MNLKAAYLYHAHARVSTCLRPRLRNHEILAQF